MDRRAALASIVGALGANIFAPLARAIAYQPNPVINTGAPEIIFTPAQRALVTALSERILPTSDTPGAIAAGVP
ncbi:hypothetical protein SAMN05518668_1211, partial [Sphingobium sp. YR657]